MTNEAHTLALNAAHSYRNIDPEHLDEQDAWVSLIKAIDALATMSSPAAKVGTEDADAQARLIAALLAVQMNAVCIPDTPGEQAISTATLKKVEDALGAYSLTIPAANRKTLMVTACCGRAECGGECGNEWAGMQPPEAMAPAAPVAAVGEAVGEVVAWRPKTQFHPDFTSGLPDEKTLAYWKLREIEIDYAYAAPQPRSSPLTADEVLVEWSRPCYPQDIHIAESFEAGVRYAERAHGILPAASMGAK